jgi:hypothetical protein
MPFYDEFDLDLNLALSTQLRAKFDTLTPAALTVENLTTLPRVQGVYNLLHRGAIVYIGKADSLPARLSQHLIKIGGRQNISVEDMEFKCLSVSRNWTTFAPEDSLIRHHKEGGMSPWNGMGFGNNDPGRKRDLTEQPSDGFDMRYPIKHEWPCDWVEAGDWRVLDLLVSLKDRLPYLLRYQTDTDGTDQVHYTKGHPEHRSATVRVPTTGMAADALVGLVARSMPGWLGTRFPSHMILYKEPPTTRYRYGTSL